MNLPLATLTTDIIFPLVETKLVDQGFTIIRKDFERPWGGFFALDEGQIEQFVQVYFPELSMDTIDKAQKLSPKILVVGPDKRLSWQYHHRRSEIWRVAQGEVGVVTSMTDEQGPVQRLKAGETIRLLKGQRHRLVGLELWGIVAEIWQHEDPSNPSNEEDIVRLQDDFGRG